VTDCRSQERRAGALSRRARVQAGSQRQAEGPLGGGAKKLEHVQKATRAEIERFHKYRSAQEVVTNFKRDLDSAPAKRIHAELRSLGLPTINDFREEFERRAEELGATG
jgi:hypothetical protein